MAAPTVVILAAGKGTRMRSETPKMLHDLCGRPLIAWPVAAALEAGAGKVVVVTGPGGELDGALPDGVEIAVQSDRDGTAGAVRAAAGQIDPANIVIVANGDVPLITAAEIAGLADAHAASGAQATMVTMELGDPSGYGRVVRDANGDVERVVETKHPEDATPEELKISEVNAGVYAFDGKALLEALDQVTADNAQGEYYLPEVLPIIRAAGGKVAAHRLDDPNVVLGVNDRVELAAVRAIAQKRIAETHMRAGVTIVDPASTLIDHGVELGPDTVVEPATFIRGTTRAGARCRIGPNTTLIDSSLGDDATVRHSYLIECDVENRVSVGPFAYLRPGAHLHDGAKAGTFVEIKNSEIGEGTKVPHLSYIGDADIGPDTNIGAGSITANYDGQAKHRTTIGARVKVSVDTAFVAPVTVGDDAYTAAGSVITDDVPPGALGVARARQENVEGYSAKRRKK